MGSDIYNNNEDANHLNQVMMLYDGAINFIQQAKEAIIQKNSDNKYKYLSKAIAIITGLNSCLNVKDATDETARTLEDFYMLVDMHLVYIKFDDRLESCDRVIENLKIMRDAWVKAERKSMDRQGSDIYNENSRISAECKESKFHVTACYN